MGTFPPEARLPLAPEASPPPPLPCSAQLLACKVLEDKVFVKKGRKVKPMAAMTKKEKEERLKRNEEKWSKTLMDAGFLIIPNVIIERQQAIGLDSVDLNILLQIALHWWEAEKLPFPSKEKIAQCIGIDSSTVRRHIASMEKAGLICRQDRWNRKTNAQQSNWYCFDGLIEAAKPFAEEEIQLRKTRQEVRREKRTRKRPLRQ